MEGQTDPELEVAFLLAVLRRYSALYGTLFELPGACAIARKHLSLQPEGARVTVLEGDLYEGLGVKRDVVLARAAMTAA